MPLWGKFAPRATVCWLRKPAKWVFSGNFQQQQNKIKPKMEKLVQWLKPYELEGISACALHYVLCAACVRMKIFHPRALLRRWLVACGVVCVFGNPKIQQDYEIWGHLALSQLSAIEMINRLKDFFVFPPPRYTKRRRNWRRVSRFRHVCRSTIASATFRRLRTMLTTRWRLAMWSKCKWQLDKYY